MKKIPGSVAKVIKKLGQPVMITWPSRAANLGVTNAPIQTFALIEGRTVSLTPGQWEKATVAMLPATARDLQDAVMTTADGQKYKLTKYETTNAGANVAMQEVILKCL